MISNSLFLRFRQCPDIQITDYSHSFSGFLRAKKRVHKDENVYQRNRFLQLTRKRRLMAIIMVFTYFTKALTSPLLGSIQFCWLGHLTLTHNRFHLVVPMCSGGIVHHPVPNVPMPHPPHVHVWASLFIIRISGVRQIVSLRVNGVAPQTINVAQPCPD